LLLALTVLLTVGIPLRGAAQDDSNDVPLGDVARNLRKQNQAKKQVIDDDNLSQVMEQRQSERASAASLHYAMSAEAKSFQLSAPDVTCSLAFTPNVKSLLTSSQYSQMELPEADLAKLEGPATIEGDALTLTLFNATNWHISEVEVALTVIKKSLDGAGSQDLNAFQQIRPEKKQDLTAIYRMRAPAPPWNRADFSAPLNLEIAPGDEWHWGIVRAKGYPPEGVTPGAAQQGVAQQGSSPQGSVQPMLLPASAPVSQTTIPATAQDSGTPNP
jgi:hypothetical protein